ncbi:MAG TPA: DUF488 domain-containing protein [Bacteroidia bacterium]|jgi:uncharacterized protein (DUF488 family)
MEIEQHTIRTIGHSTRSLNEFVEILKSFQIELLADIRNYPGSKRYPHFNKENLEVSLRDNDIEYVHLKSLGGRRKALPDSKNTGWRSAAFKGYADYMDSKEFLQGITELGEHAGNKRTAYMCSEAVWWRCHRSLVSDYLKARGWKVIHIMGIGKEQEHPYTSPARIVGGHLTYTTEIKKSGRDHPTLFDV